MSSVGRGDYTDINIPSSNPFTLARLMSKDNVKTYLLMHPTTQPHNPPPLSIHTLQQQHSHQPVSQVIRCKRHIEAISSMRITCKLFKPRIQYKCMDARNYTRSNLSINVSCYVAYAGEV